ncbi:hypothetical protein BP5796_02791 [Coleophoma crateriformis]|uniref:Alpha/beta hydrolase fold-3 domain-containing protein n=1 Tax=Coleophoma crateriformis TaxID=565419 RepID=A0A3D8SZA3_9HELO|nr:hypothetical protein BP5796_02791 [Coleophoma crateriformis]
MASGIIPHAPEWLKLEEAFGFKPLVLGTPQEMREQYAAWCGLNLASTPPIGDDVSFEDHQIDSELMVRVYSPKEKKEQGAVGIKFFAGGWTIGSLESEHYLSYLFAQQTNTVIVAVNYRLAPEHKYPAAHDDAKRSLSWVIANATALGVSPEKIYTMGTSAGGQMALSLALSSLDSKYNIKGVVALVPVTVHPDAIPAELKSEFTPEKNPHCSLLSYESMAVFYETYGAPPNHPEFSILINENLARLPRTYLAVCGKDPLRYDGLALAKVMKEKGAEVQMDLFEGLPHIFWSCPGFELTPPALEKMVQGMKWVIESI